MITKREKMEMLLAFQLMSLHSMEYDMLFRKENNLPIQRLAYEISKTKDAIASLEEELEKQGV